MAVRRAAGRPAHAAPGTVPQSADGDEVIEGFLCPECRANLHTEADLQRHFTDVHAPDAPQPSRATDKRYLPAKPTLLRALVSGISGRRAAGTEAGSGEDRDHPALTSGPAPPAAAGTQPTDSHTGHVVYDDNDLVDDATGSRARERGYLLVDEDMRGPAVVAQTPGPTRRHTEDFEKRRSGQHERLKRETGLMISRLERILEARQLRDAEQAVTPWQSARDTQKCTVCGDSFKFFSMTHHCRLCGVAVCNKTGEDGCSGTMPRHLAQQIVQRFRGGARIAPASDAAPPSDAGGAFIRSLVSNIRPHAESSDIRLCRNCMQAMSSHVRAAERKPMALPKYVIMHKQLTELRDAIEDTFVHLQRAVDLVASLQARDPRALVDARDDAVRLKSDLAGRLRDYGARGEAIRALPLDAGEPTGSSGSQDQGQGGLHKRVQENIAMAVGSYVEQCVRRLEAVLPNSVLQTWQQQRQQQQHRKPQLPQQTSPPQGPLPWKQTASMQTRQQPAASERSKDWLGESAMDRSVFLLQRARLAEDLKAARSRGDADAADVLERAMEDIDRELEQR